MACSLEPSTWHTKKNKLYETLDYWGIVSPPHSVDDFSRKMFLMLYSIFCIAIVYFSVCDFINLKIKLIFLSKPLLYMTKKSRQKIFRYLENEKNFQDEIKRIFHHF